MWEMPFFVHVSGKGKQEGVNNNGGDTPQRGIQTFSYSKLSIHMVCCWSCFLDSFQMLIENLKMKIEK